MKWFTNKEEYESNNWWKKYSSVTSEDKFLYMFYFNFAKQYTIHFSISLWSLPCRASSPLYTLLLGILALHLYAPKLFLGYLSYQGFVEGGRRGC